MTRKRPAMLHLLTALALATGVLLLALPRLQSPVPDAQPPRVTAAKPAVDTGPGWVGARACAGCHAEQARAWQGSQHDLAQQEATEASVLGDFDDAAFEHAGVRSSFFRRDGGYWVNTDGPDGRLQDYRIRFVIGVYPLQQYLVDFPDGRVQTLSIAWDSRPAEAGGQRWFHLYPERTPKPGDPLHWTGIDQTWNHQCAACHATGLRKNVDATTGRYATKWAEFNVACEACHGPGASHVAWAGQDAERRRLDAAMGLRNPLTERKGAHWTIDPTTGNARRNVARDTRREIDTCGVCHARRGQFADAVPSGAPLAERFHVAVLAPGLYYPDGQQRDEVYNYGSFLQSRMYAMGVSCSDCHDPHTQKLRAPGNAVCAQCHAPATYDVASHHHHVPGGEGARCAACHMPTTTYMGVDPRHDHSFRIPRPDRSIRMGVPNACTQCHGDKPAAWAEQALQRWYPQRAPGHQAFAEALWSAATEAADVRPALRGVLADPAAPAIARASAAAQLAAYPEPSNVALLTTALTDADPLLRAAAVEAIGTLDPALRARELPALLEDPVRSVRMAAAVALADTDIAPGRAAARTRALREYVDAQQYDADRPEAQLNLGNLSARQGDVRAAEASYRRALAIDPVFAPAAVNLAELLRTRGDEAAAGQVLREALARTPEEPALHHALAMSLVRQGRTAEGLAALAEAVRLAPGDSRYAWIHAIALNSTGKAGDALAALATAHRRFPGNAEILRALATIAFERGDLETARGHAERLVELVPEDPAVRQLLQHLQQR